MSMKKYCILRCVGTDSLTTLIANENTSLGGCVMYYAHSTAESDRSNWQPLSVHLSAVARLAQQLGDPIGIGRAAGFAGLLHDLGKYTAKFQARLDGSAERTDHSTAGAVIAPKLAEGQLLILG